MSSYKKIKTFFIEPKNYKRVDLLNAILESLYKANYHTLFAHELNSSAYEIVKEEKHFLVLAPEYVDSMKYLIEKEYIKNPNTGEFKLAHKGVMKYEKGGFLVKQKSKAAKLKTPFYANWRYIIGIIAGILTIILTLIKLNLL